MAAKVIARLSGLVSYSDGSNGQFAGTLDGQGRVAFNNRAASLKTVGEVDADTNWLDNMFALVPNLTFNPTSSNTKVVTSMNADFVIRLALAESALQLGKPSWEEYHVAFWIRKNSTGAVIGAFKDVKSAPAIGANGTTPWAKIYASTALKTSLATLLTPFGVTIS